MSKEIGRSPEEAIFYQASIADLIGIPSQEVSEGKGLYLALAKRKLDIGRFSESSVCVLFPPLTGEELAALRYFAAPSKNNSYRFDFRDTQMDWNTLFTDQDEDNLRRLRAHRRIPGWNYLENNWQDILAFMEEGMVRHDAKVLADQQSKRFRSAACFQKEGDIWNWNLEVVDAAGGPQSWAWLSTLYIAGYAPEITSTWGPRSDYAGRPTASWELGSQDMGPTQAIPLALWKRDDLIGSKLVQKILEISEQTTA